MQAEVKDKFLRFIATKTDEAVFSPKEGYFPFSVIADAFEKGTEHGEEAFKQKVRDLYVKNIEIALDAIGKLLSCIEENNYKVNKLYLNHSISQSLVLIGVDEALIYDENFINIAYSKASEIQSSTSVEKEANIEIGFIDTTDIDEDLVLHEGYTFSYDFNKQKSA
jgi:hypothetical protein